MHKGDPGVIVLNNLPAQNTTLGVVRVKCHVKKKLHYNINSLGIEILQRSDISTNFHNTQTVTDLFNRLLTS